MKNRAFLWIAFLTVSFSFCVAAASAQTAGPDYKNVRIKKFPVAMQCWTFHEFTFVETLQKVKALGIEYIQAYPGQPLGGGFPEKAVFDHNLPDDQIRAVKQKLREHGLKIVAYGVVDTGRTEESMRKVFEFAGKMGFRTIVTEPADGDFGLLDKLIKEYDIQVAIHNHPEPSKYARPETVLGRVRARDGRLGSSADTGHWMRTGVNPLEALRMLSGRIRDVHFKDLNAFGVKDAWDVPFGQGKANIHDILAELTLQDYDGYLTIEHENKKELKNPGPSVAKGLEYLKSITYYEGYDQILGRREGRYSKHGWNHYGPGYFDLCEKMGVLKSQGGMGLLWFSAKTYKDFVLELDYRCENMKTNSGIFLRIPAVPSSDDYIYHSFEVQIYDAGQGIHMTGAVYDAEAPRAAPFNPAPEWNHMKITFKGKRIQVEINGVPVQDWQAEPRGKIKDFASEGYIGLQNHDSIAPVYFKDIFIKEL